MIKWSIGRRLLGWSWATNGLTTATIYVRDNHWRNFINMVRLQYQKNGPINLYKERPFIYLSAHFYSLDY